MNFINRLFRRPALIKLFHWEYWSFNMVYVWIYPIFFLLCARARSFFFFAAANPAIRNGGFLNESKKAIYELMPRHLYPRTIYFSLPVNKESVLKDIIKGEFYFPLIGKPDSGGKGRGVKILKDERDVLQYAEQALVDFHIQQFVPYEKEVGIFYYRFPGQDNGRLSGIVKKEFLSVRGDGFNAIRKLLMKEDRAILQMKSLERIYGNELDTILPDGQKKIMVPYGNHARGAKFLDDSHLIDQQLTTVIDNVCKQVKEFYFGRLDIRYRDWEELKAGKNFCVIEVNGAGSEPTHIYDPRHTLFFAWKEIIRHWIILCRISRLNHKQGHSYLSIKDGLAMFREDSLQSEKLGGMPE